MQLEESSLKIKKKKKQIKKPLPRNVFDIVGESGQLVERVDPNRAPKKVETSEEAEPKPTFSERTKKRRVSHHALFLSIDRSLILVRQRREWDAMNYEPFDMTRGREYERSLQRIATRGIVQLFNTVRKQQQHSSSSTKEKKEGGINKGEFLDMLRNIDSDETAFKVMKKTSSAVRRPRLDRSLFRIRLLLLQVTSTKTAKPVRWNALQDDLMASVKDDDDDDDDD